jgi:hypothetical protein
MTAASRVLFLVVGGFWLLIGVLGAALSDKGIGPPMIFVSERTDTALYGGPPDKVLDSNRALRDFRYVAIRVLSGLLVATGLLTLGITWFGLRAPEPWALAALTVIGLGILPFWWAAFGPYRAAGVRLSLGDVPPFMWLPAVLAPLAGILGWIGILRS